MHYTLILLTGSLPELIGTFSSLTACLDMAGVLDGMCIEVGLLERLKQ